MYREYGEYGGAWKTHRHIGRSSEQLGVLWLFWFEMVGETLLLSGLWTKWNTSWMVPALS